MIQLGGIGYMGFATMAALLVKRRITHRDRVILKESINYPGVTGIVRFIKQAIGLVLVVEVIAALFLAMRFALMMPWDQALWFGFFHAVSAFNNAGFSLFENNMMGFATDLTINVVIGLLIVVGGIGYVVLLELYYSQQRQLTRLSTHTKVVLLTSMILILAGMLLILSLEGVNPKTLGPFAWYDKIMISWFMSVNFRTAGFNTIDISGLTDSNLFFSTILMMVGGAPGGTAGGIKVTTLAIIIIGVWFTLRGQRYPHIFRRSISQETISKANAILMVASFYVLVSTVLITEVERLPFLRILFEVVSAFGTVGLSTGNGGVLSYCSIFSDISKLNIIILMIIGRVGVLIFTLSLLGRSIESRIHYAEGKVQL
ncbi:MAG: potassium transporter [Campylobacterales bacterium]